MPANDPLGYLPPQTVEQLLGRFVSPPQAASLAGRDAVGQLSANLDVFDMLRGARAQSPDMLLARGGNFSVPGLGNISDQSIQGAIDRYQGSRQPVPQKFLEEKQRRVARNLWGVA